MAFVGAPGASCSSTILATPSWIYDVFLSFHGEDTRKGFVDHLYAALKRKGIITFRDDKKLKPGEHIAKELFEAIEKSRYAIVVISRRYAFSKWCLIELTKILKCREMTGIIVLPVFYYVDPSHVRKQQGSFAEVFSKHNQNTEVDEEQRKMWTAALKDIGNLTGWHIDNRHEATIIEDISRKILDEMNHTSSNIFEGLVGISSQASKLISLLSIGSSNVRFIGICGMGGIGKTTLAKVVYDQVSSHFEASCFVAHIREETHIELLQTQLICEILQERELKVWNIYIGIDIMKRRMRNRNIFMVLDDVDTEKKLKALVGSHVWFGEGSRVIITSRDRHLLERFVDEIYEIRELSEDESLELFSWNAFKKDHPEEGYVELSKDVVHFAQGLPLAIEVFGAYLFGRTMNEWKSAHEQLKANLKADILDILKISFDGLEDPQKELFLDIACLFDENYFRDYNILECLQDHLAIDVKILQDKCLIKKFHATYHMHNLLKKMGQQIVNRECPSNPGRRSRLWCYEDIVNVLKNNTGTYKIEAIVLDLSLHKGEQLNLEGFSKMMRLRMLLIRNDQSYHEFHALEWNGKLSKFMLSNELRYLEWDGYPLENLPINFQANKLVKLKMPYNCIKQLNGWKNFVKLKSIDMSYSRNLIEIPDFSELSNLVELDLQYCRSLSTVHSSIGNLKQLKKLDMEGCDSLNKLPNEINLESLEYLNLAGCLRLEKFPNVGGNMESLEFLDLIGTTIKEFPPSFKGLSSLKYFNLCGSMSHRIRLERAEYLQHKPDQFLEYDPSRQPTSTKLMSEIYASGSGNHIGFLHFLDVFSSLSSMKRLDISYRNLSDGIIPYELCYLTSLEYLDLSGNKLTTIPFSIYLLPKLQFLYLRSCTSLRTLPKPLSSQLSCLELLHLGYCKMADGVIPDDLSCFSSLKRLDLCNNKVKRLPNLIQLSQLRNLCLEDCTKLEALPKLPLSLRSLWIRGCVSLKTPWVEMYEGLNSNYPIGVVRFDYDGRPHPILQGPSYPQISLSSDGMSILKRAYIVAPASVSKIPEWFNQRITGSFGTIESCCNLRNRWEHWGGYALLVLYRLKPNSFQEKMKKQKVNENGKSNYGIFDGINPVLPHFLCHFQLNKAEAKYSFLLSAPETPSVGLNAFCTHIPSQCFKGIWKLENTSTSIEASIESFNLNVETECGMRVVNENDLPVLSKVISDISPCALNIETCKNLLESDLPS